MNINESNYPEHLIKTTSDGKYTVYLPLDIYMTDEELSESAEYWLQVKKDYARIIEL